MHSISRRGLLAAIGTASFAGCASANPSFVGDNSSSKGEEPRDDRNVVQGVPLASSQLPVEYDFQKLRDEVVSGGPPKDGIPSIDEPKFWSAEEADAELADEDVVFGLVRNGEVKAYPQKILAQHEITNDVVGDEPVSVTYCPLTGTAMGFLRGETTFGVSGNLVNNNLVMYDRATDSRWPQMLGTAISGEFESESLREFRLVWTEWQHWREVHPETTVLSTDTGFARNYDRDPYGSYVPNRSGYYVQDRTLFPALQEDDAFPRKHVVLGARTDDGRIAVEKSALREAGLLSGSVGGTPLLAVYDPDLDTGYFYWNPDGSSFEYADGEVTGPDGETHAPADLPLDRVYAYDAMWFAWAGFYPSTGVIR